MKKILLSSLAALAVLYSAAVINASITNAAFTPVPWTLDSVTLTGATTLPGSSQIAATTGYLGIGAAANAAAPVDVTSNANSQFFIRIQNANASTAAAAAFLAGNGTSDTRLFQYGTGFTTSGINRQNGGKLESNGAGGLTLSTSVNQPVYIAANGGQVMSFISTGPIITAIPADTATTDATLCRNTSTGAMQTGTGAVGICLGTSSARFKHDIVPLKATDRILALRPVKYRYNEGIIDNGIKDQFGFTAEEVVKVMPELVGLGPEGQPNTVDLVAMIPFMILKMQEQEAKIKKLSASHSKTVH